MSKSKKYIFELPLYNYFGKAYDRETKTYDKPINSLQEYQEHLMDSFESCAPYIQSDSIDDSLPEATAYIREQTRATKAELELFADDIENDTRRALVGAYDSNYQSEWIAKFKELLLARIDSDVEDATEKAPYKVLTDFDSPDFWEAESVKIEMTKKDLIRACGYDKMPKDYTIEDLEDQQTNAFIDMPSAINTEYIDQYNSLGSFDHWMDCFTAYEETTANIKEHRAEEKAKINNSKKALDNLAPEINTVKSYIQKYITKPEANNKITRQIKALESVIKTAI